MKTLNLNQNNKLQSHNISLDTSFIESQNFLAGSKIKELPIICKKSKIKLFITDIIYREILYRFKNNLNQTEEKTKKPKDLLSNHAKLLRNFEEYSGYFNLPSIDIEDLFHRFKSVFDNWINKNGITIIPTGSLRIKNVFSNYFENKPPFKEGKKKHEFPDAFSIESFKNYFKKKKTNTYLLTSDNDLLDFENNKIIPVKDVAPLFDLIIRNSNEALVKRAIEFIEKEFQFSKTRLESDTKGFIIASIEDEIESTYKINELEIDSVNHIDVGEIELSKFSIVKLDIDESEANLECEIMISFEVSFEAHDLSDSWYDKEIDKWYFVDSRTHTIEEEIEINVQLSAYFNLDEDYAEIEVESIENGDRLDIFSSLRTWG